MSRLDHHIQGQTSFRRNKDKNKSYGSAEGANSSETNNNEIIIEGNHHNPGMVDSYEIYGENNQDEIDESEIDIEED